jgi:hypothetical protein
MALRGRHGCADCRHRGSIDDVITLETYFGSFTATSQPSQETRDNAINLLAKVNSLLADVDLPEAAAPRVNSGWRPAWYNATVANAAPKSKHITGEAIDLADPEGALDDFLMADQSFLVRHGLYMEHPLSTKGWCHLQCAAPRSGNRVFYP